MDGIYSLGRVKWFDPGRRHGALGTISGGTFYFERPDGDVSLLTKGQLVMFSDAGSGRLGRMAQDISPVDGALRPLTSRTA
jgi:hypothetical protein